jgi:hypothetical protein
MRKHLAVRTHLSFELEKNISEAIPETPWRAGLTRNERAREPAHGGRVRHQKRLPRDAGSRWRRPGRAAVRRFSLSEVNGQTLGATVKSA